jgi:endonuclease/exonuclease/phosphatase (EEP) superfamily protein YafD
MIALKKEKGFEVKRILTENPIEKEKPEFLQVETELEGKSFAIIGVRIKTQGTNKQIDSQFEFLKDHLKTLENSNVLCAGDFNVWKTPLSKKLNITSKYIFTPEYSMVDGDFNTLDTWSAVIKNSKTNVVGKALIDHIIAKGVGIKEVIDLKYSWDFVSEKNSYGNLKPEDYKSHLVGLPDHAILSATVELKD